MSWPGMGTQAECYKKDKQEGRFLPYSGGKRGKAKYRGENGTGWDELYVVPFSQSSLQDVGINFFPSSDYYSHYPKGVKYLNRRP